MRLNRLALQLFSLRREMEMDPERSLRRVRQLGFDGVELAGTYGWSVEKWKDLLCETGLRVVGAHIGIDVLETAFEEEVAFQAALGNGRIIVPSLRHEPRRRVYEEYAIRFNRVAKRLARQNFTLLYHNHAFEFEPLVEGGCGMDVLLAETDAALVKFEFDTGWLECAGHQAEEFLFQNAPRTKMIHAKDFRKSDGAAVPCGDGDVNFQRIMPFVLAQGWEVVVEFEGEEAEEGVERSARHLSRWL